MIYVPSNIEEFHPISLAIGWKRAKAVSQRFGGQQLAIPGEANILLDIRNEMILEERSKGTSLRATAHKYGISERMVRKIEEKTRNRSALIERHVAGEN